MAIIYSYPINTNILATDIIVGSSTAIVNGRPKNQTKSFEISDLAAYFASVIAPPGTYVPYNGATGPVNLGAYDLTLNGATIGRGGGQIYSNIVFGLSSLLNNTTGQNNTYLGFSSGYYNTIGSYNTAIGAFASQFTTTGSSNTTIGNYALYTNTTGSNNLAIGYGALGTNTTGSGNVAIGYQTQALNPTDVNSIIIGTSATGAGSNTVVLGNTSITTTRLRGNVQGGAFVKDGGTNVQFLMADGSVSTAPSLTGFVPYTGATGAVNLGAYDLTVNGLTVGKGTGALLNNTVLGSLCLYQNTSGNFNTAIGKESLTANTTGTSNTGVGFRALWSTTTSSANTGFGSNSLYLNTTGSNNTGIGRSALQDNTVGNLNCALGSSALQVNTIGSNNTAVGFKSLWQNTIGSNNTAVGLEALRQNTTGIDNVAIGYLTLANNTTSINNVAIGNLTLGLSNYPSVGNNTAVGYNALGNQTAAYNNTAFGANALQANTTGTYNVGIGAFAFQGVTTGSYNLGVGMSAAIGLTIGTQNTHIGHYGNCASNSDTNSTQLGYNVIGSGSNSVTIGNASVTLTRLRGQVRGGSFVKDSGTAIEYLMANGSVSTNGTLFSSVSTTYQIAAGTLQSISSAIPSSIFTSGNLLKLNAVITTTAATVAIATIEFYINSAATTVGATLIGRYNGPIGNQYIPIDRFFWVSGTTLYGRDFTASASTSTSNSAFAINSVLIPATQFYIIAQVTTTLTDRAAISSFKIEKS
jgi:hypothetical protein